MMQIIRKTYDKFFMQLIFKVMLPPLRLVKGLASTPNLKARAAAIQNQVQIINQIFYFLSNALSATFALPKGWRCAVVFPQCLAEMSVCNVAKSQTDLYDQKASATVHWLLGNGLNSRNTGEKPTTEYKKNSLKYPQRI